MEPEDILGKLERALEDERVAIRGLNGPQVEACAARKTALVGELMQIDARRRAPLAKRLKALVDQLRLNGVLLVHARRILGDVLRLKGAAANATLPQLTKVPVPTSGSRLSVRG